MDLQEKKLLETLGDRLRDRRHEMGLTQVQLAEKCGLHRTFVAMVERGERNVALLNLRKIAKALRIRLGDLFDGL